MKNSSQQQKIALMQQPSLIQNHKSLAKFTNQLLPTSNNNQASANRMQSASGMVIPTNQRPSISKPSQANASNNANSANGVKTSARLASSGARQAAQQQQRLSANNSGVDQNKMSKKALHDLHKHGMQSPYVQPQRFIWQSSAQNPGQPTAPGQSGLSQQRTGSQQSTKNTKVNESSASGGTVAGNSNYVVSSILPPGQIMLTSKQGQTTIATNTSSSGKTIPTSIHLKHQIQQRPPTGSKKKNSNSSNKLALKELAAQQTHHQQQQLLGLPQTTTSQVNHNMGYSAQNVRNFYPPVMVQLKSNKSQQQATMVSAASPIISGQSNATTPMTLQAAEVASSSQPNPEHLDNHLQQDQQTLYMLKVIQKQQLTGQDHLQQPIATTMPKQLQQKSLTPTPSLPNKDFNLYMRQQQAQIQTKNSQTPQQLMQSSSSGFTQGRLSQQKRVPPVSLVNPRERQRLKQAATPSPVLQANSLVGRRGGGGDQRDEQPPSSSEMSRGLGVSARSQADLHSSNGFPKNQSNFMRQRQIVKTQLQQQQKHSLRVNESAKSNSNNLSVESIKQVSRTIDYDGKSSEIAIRQNNISLAVDPLTSSSHGQSQNYNLQTLQPVADKSKNSHGLVQNQQSVGGAQTSIMTQELQQKYQKNKKKLESKSIETKSARNLKQALLDSINYDRDQATVSDKSKPQQNDAKSQKPSQISFRSRMLAKRENESSAKELPQQTALIMRQKFYEKKPSAAKQDNQVKSNSNSTNNNSSIESAQAKATVQSMNTSSIVSQDSVAQTISAAPQHPPGSQLHQFVKIRKSIMTQQQRSPDKKKQFNEDLTHVELNTIQVSSNSLNASDSLLKQQVESQINSDHNGSKSKQDSLDEIVPDSQARSVKFNSNESLEHQQSELTAAPTVDRRNQLVIVRKQQTLKASSTKKLKIQESPSNTSTLLPSLSITNLVLPSNLPATVSDKAGVERRNTADRVNDSGAAAANESSFYVNSEQTLPVANNNSGEDQDSFRLPPAKERKRKTEMTVSPEVSLEEEEESRITAMIARQLRGEEILEEGNFDPKVAAMTDSKESTMKELDALEIKVDLTTQNSRPSLLPVRSGSALPQPEPQVMITENRQGMQGQSINSKRNSPSSVIQSSQQVASVPTQTANPGSSDSRNPNLRPNTQIEISNNTGVNHKDQISPQNNNCHNHLNDSKTGTRQQTLQSRHGTNLFSFGNITPEFYEQQAIMLEKKTTKSPASKHDPHRSYRLQAKQRALHDETSNVYMDHASVMPLYKNSERQKQILIVTKPRSRASSRTDQHMGGNSTEIYEKRYSRTSDEDMDTEVERSSMRTADFRKNNLHGGGNLSGVQSGPNCGVVSKQSTTNKTPKFLLSPRTNSLANSISTNHQHNSLNVKKDQSEIQVNDQSEYREEEGVNQRGQKWMHQKMLESQTSDEIYRVVNDFHMRRGYIDNFSDYQYYSVNYDDGDDDGEYEYDDGETETEEERSTQQESFNQRQSHNQRLRKMHPGLINISSQNNSLQHLHKHHPQHQYLEQLDLHAEYYSDNEGEDGYDTAEDQTIDHFLDGGDLIEQIQQQNRQIPDWQAQVSKYGRQKHQLASSNPPPEGIQYYNMPKKLAMKSKSQLQHQHQHQQPMQQKQRADGSGMLIFHNNQQPNVRVPPLNQKAYHGKKSPTSGISHTYGVKQPVPEIASYRYPQQTSASAVSQAKANQSQSNISKAQMKQQQQQLQGPGHPLISQQSKQTEALMRRSGAAFPQSTTGAQLNARPASKQLTAHASSQPQFSKRASHQKRHSPQPAMIDNEQAESMQKRSVSQTKLHQGQQNQLLQHHNKAAKRAN